METVTLPANLTAPDLERDAVSPGAASLHLAQQLIELDGTGRAAQLRQPVPQHIGLPLMTELLQQSDARRRVHGLQIALRQLVQQHLGLGRVRGTSGHECGCG